MSFAVDQALYWGPLDVKQRLDGDETVFTVNQTGRFQIEAPGRLNAVHEAYVICFSGELPQNGRLSMSSTKLRLEMKFKLFDPDDNEFTKDRVTVADLLAFRDLRGLPMGSLWGFTLEGEKRHKLVGNESFGEPFGAINIGLATEIPSSSAPPLIPRTGIDSTNLTMPFDLWRLGRLEATVGGTGVWNGTMHLLDPEDNEIASSTSNTLIHQVVPTDLRMSRGRRGRPPLPPYRPWRIELRPQGPLDTGITLSAHVFDESRLDTGVINRRLLTMLGTNGRYIRLEGQNSSGPLGSGERAEVRIMIDDPVAAEAFERYGLIEDLLKEEKQDPGRYPNRIEPRASYILFSGDALRGDTVQVRIDVESLEVTSINAVVGAGIHSGGAPALNVQVGVAGQVKVTAPALGDLKLGSAEIENNKLEFEVGLVLDADGTPKFVTYVQDDVVDFDLSIVTHLLATTANPLIEAAALIAKEYLEHELNDYIKEKVRRWFDEPGRAAKLVRALMGGLLRYTNIAVDGDDLLFEYVAPLEGDPKSRDDGYIGVQGRHPIEGPDGRFMMEPPVGNTWAAPNLRSKIKHIVYVVMENRSYDHVLGFRSFAPIPTDVGADGWTNDLKAVVEAEGQGHKVINLADAAFQVNELNKMTRFPKSVGHKHIYVKEQLSQQIPGPGGDLITGPKGFVENFAREYVGTDRPETTDIDERLGVVGDDVLGYYDAYALPMYDYLAANYAYCDRFFSSHPGPTLPNRMYALAGDVQYDYQNIPILENNKGDNWVLSRAQTIFDVLDRRGVTWKVYESEPSVAMLRMFAKYAGESERIVPMDEFERDLDTNGLPQFCVIEPQMHADPEDDDHPPYDMWRGQQFIHRVYSALRNLRSWNDTLLIITYDEHGGFYDHVIPPLAEIYDAGVGGANLPGGGPMATSDPIGDDTSGDGTRLGPFDEPGDVGLGTDDAPVPPKQQRVDIPYGVRVPTFIVSPWAPQGVGPSEVYDFCSILKTVLATFTRDRPFMSDRVSAARSLDAYLSEPSARVSPAVPDPLEAFPNVAAAPREADESAITTPPFSGLAMSEGADGHEVMGFIGRTLGR